VKIVGHAAFEFAEFAKFPGILQVGEKAKASQVCLR
jgi:hypothetical protein